jgi:hypothetical protein
MRVKRFLGYASFRTFPKNILETEATGKLLHNAHDSRHLLVGFVLSEHHIFMLALAKLRE